MNFLFKLSLIPSAVGGILLIYKSYFAVPVYIGNEDLTDKVVVITGGSSGIGQDIAFQLAKRNANVIMACRNMANCNTKRLRIFSKTKNANVYCSELDLNSLDSIEQFTKRLSKRMKKIDIVVHNAGVKSGKLRKLSHDHIEEQLAINVMAPFLLNKLLLPILSTDARVVTLICPQYAKGIINKDDINFDKSFDKDVAFAQSQLMRTVTSFYLSETSKNVTYVTCDPGPANSNFHKNEPYNGNIVSRNIFKYINLFLLRNTWQGASTPVMCCCSINIKTGSHYRDLQSLSLDPIVLSDDNVKYVIALCNKWTSQFNTAKTGNLGA